MTDLDDTLPGLPVSRPTGVGLCLSGGGYRAMLFHLGTLWRLNDAGYLPKLTRISSVSGGSITAGLLGCTWRNLEFDQTGVAIDFLEHVVEPILAMGRYTLDVPAVLKGLLFGGVAHEVEGVYDRMLYHGATLQSLPDDNSGPRFIIMATDLSNGVGWRFSRPYMRDYKTANYPNPTLPLAQAVAASSAFPPFLSPVVLNLVLRRCLDLGCRLAEPGEFTRRNKDAWDWTMLIPLPDQVDAHDIAAGLAKAALKKPALPAVRVMTLDEGLCLQILHLGSFDSEAETLARLHDQVMPERGLTFNGRHHEIYLLSLIHI